MKRNPWICAAVVLASFVSLASAQEAYSVNAIGVVKKEVPAGKLVFISFPLDGEGAVAEGTPFQSVSSISNMPNGSVANFWDVETQRWVVQLKTAKGGWGTQANRLIQPGEAFFLKNSQTTNMTLLFTGEVPADASMSQGLASGAFIAGANPYPVATVLSNFAFASTMANGSVANFWDVETQRWVVQLKTAKGGWGAQASREVAPGEGFFLKSYSGDLTWTETRPYTWPD